MKPVSIVIPSLGDTALLGRALTSLRPELARRAAGDEVLVVDDTGDAELRSFLAGEHPEVTYIPRRANGGFARAITAGIEAARCELVFSMNSDLEVRPGLLEPLVEALEDLEIFAAVPRVVRGAEPAPNGRPAASNGRLNGLLHGDGDGGGSSDSKGRVESLVRLVFEGGALKLEQPCLESPGLAIPDPELGPLPVPFALGGAFLFRAADFTSMGGFDPLFEPFYLEDVDLCWRAWRAGKRVVYVPSSEAVHVNQGTIGTRVSAALRDAVIERNLLLLLWKHLDDERALSAHLEDLERRARAAWVDEQRGPLEVLVLAFERLDQALASRAVLPRARRTFETIARLSDPFAAAEARLARD